MYNMFRQDISSIAKTNGYQENDYSLYVSAQRFPIQTTGFKAMTEVKKKGNAVKGKVLDYRQQYYSSNQESSEGNLVFDQTNAQLMSSTENFNLTKSITSLPDTTPFAEQPQQNALSQNSLPTQPQPPSSSESYRSPRRKNFEEIIIHVHDDTNKINKDFTCNRELLMSEMKYFKYYLMQPKAKNEEIDISVHCDVNIFQWLMDYIKKETLTPPKLEVNWAISILISSHFLEMDSLVETTLDFVRENIESILKLPIDLDCIHTDLLEKLAIRFTDYDLDEVKDKKDKILSKLFMKKLEMLLEEEENTLYKCQHCQTMFTKSQLEWMICNSEKAKIQIDFHGRAISRHALDKTWNVDKYFYKLKKSGMSWRDIYWRFWSLTHSYFCLSCKQHFVAAEYHHCTYHKKEAVFERGSIVGEHPCCGAKSLKFNSGIIVPKGCCSKSHTIFENQEIDGLTDKSLISLLQNHADVLTPFVGVQSSTTSSVNPEDDNEIEFELLEKKTKKEESEDEEEDESEDSMDLFTEKSCKYKIFDDFNGGERTTHEKAQPTNEEKKKVNSKRFHSMDIQRNIDRENIYEIIKTLRKCRKKQPVEEPQLSKTKQTPSKKKSSTSKVVTTTPGKKPMTTHNKKR
ncbi:hypothetical protein C9374_006924 [Naegleria lovaniensis]|uniref:SANT and BTB domain-containing protein n=1 Tax=Naegleria lovaniensis TaxID=51637 RepID=A0AA88GYJ1_NAELO|nr:uncharacterized protein C9374_006924 [Naegleria lovaniensis]KAG2393393.1 hypothetical protein C9374_006924 [Naegleria lovaniensis]